MQFGHVAESAGLLYNSVHATVKAGVMKKFIVAFLAVVHVMVANVSYAWHDETHLAIAKAAGYARWYNMAGPDIAKQKAGSLEKYNHYFNNPMNKEVTPALVLDQVGRYNNPNDQYGHLYGAIIASLKQYAESKIEGKYAEYHLVYCAHYIGDLSNPLHNTPYDDFNKRRHSANDGVVEQEVLARLERINAYMIPVELRKDHLDDDLAREISRIANITRRLGYVLREERRDMTEREAYIQLGYSASLLRAVLDVLEKR